MRWNVFCTRPGWLVWWVSCGAAVPLGTLYFVALYPCCSDVRICDDGDYCMCHMFYGEASLTNTGMLWIVLFTSQRLPCALHLNSIYNGLFIQNSLQ